MMLKRDTAAYGRVMSTTTALSTPPGSPQRVE